MTKQNKSMKAFLTVHGINAKPKYIASGSLAGCWRLSNLKIDWWNNPELWAKLSALGFVDFDTKPLDKFSGNGGVFSIFTRNKNYSK